LKVLHSVNLGSSIFLQNNVSSDNIYVPSNNEYIRIYGNNSNDRNMISSGYHHLKNEKKTTLNNKLTPAC
jgi:hypothetical protein